MNDLADIRRAHLQRLVDENGLTSVAKRMKRSPTQINDMLAGRKSFGEKVARAMEYEWDPSLSLGWMSVPSDPELTPPSPRDPHSVTIRQYEDGGSMGNGLELRDQPGLICQWQVSHEWLSKNVRAYSAARNLCIVTGFGDSMEPMFNPGDPLLVDIGVTTVEFDAVYFFRVGTEGYIKRLQRIPTATGLVLRAISENRQAYEPFDIVDGMDFRVLGRVLKVWRSQDF